MVFLLKGKKLISVLGCSLSAGCAVSPSESRTFPSNQLAKGVLVMKKITSWNEFEAIRTSSPYYFLKNSTTCPISGAAYEEVQKFAEDHPDVPFYYLNVQESRPLSNQIAEEFNVKHESPQLFLFNGREVVFHDSHWEITYDQVEKLTKEHF
jgi:bacillithiol system protein YtxJ